MIKGRKKGEEVVESKVDGKREKKEKSERAGEIKVEKTPSPEESGIDRG